MTTHFDVAHRLYLTRTAVALSRSAYREAVAYFEPALAALGQLPERRDMLEQAVDLRFDLRDAYMVLGQHERILYDLRAAETLAEAMDDPRRLGRVSLYMAQYFTAVGQNDDAIASSQRALALAEELGMRPLVAHCHHGLGRLYAQTGLAEQARTALITAIELYRAMDMTFWLPQAEAVLAQVA